ncbi:ATP-binding protein [Tritonibacter mobilis]|uniref:ATP-binding protein n=1 Tax=Tritonibacter mobilis TaxID=379347 RepID=UPI0014039C0C|nr:ATP-binding protein [Tritonibacter mobilis]NHM18694.1 ATP-binding protein [Tritonibacter mobilis]NHM22791.1 ATP-binding protein [Tritonibacter mobilis]
MSIQIGEVVAVMGVEVSVRAFENSNHETHFFNGKKFKGISIREFVSISHGFREIVCTVEGEYLDERNFELEASEKLFTRKLKLRPIGYFEDDAFKDGIKYLPKIGDIATLLSEQQVGSIFESKSSDGYIIGKLLKEDLPIALPWQKLFNSHLGIFGNTGSGKSNTLTKLFTVLFANKLNSIASHSKFVVLDFNGEYTGDQLVGADHKKVVRLTTRNAEGDRFKIHDDEFWDAETLGILFQATTNTQKPFLRRTISGRARFIDVPDSLTHYARATIRRVLCSTDPSVEALEQVKSLVRQMPDAENLAELVGKVGWNNTNRSFYLIVDGQMRYPDNEAHFGAIFEPQISRIDLQNLSGFTELQVRASLQLINDVQFGSAQYEHIQPLLRRIDSLKEEFSRVISVGELADDEDRLVTVISLRECKQDVKKILPILIAKHFYEQHRSVVTSPPSTTLHLIVDEAHNILSQQSNREAESWKDYRLELFEEIIKEGRKFGVFLTIASQRPADISPTIVSQLHNYFVHRLVNDRDLALLENTISTLDSLSRGQIPTLPQGACVVTGTSFDIPMLMQVDKLPKEQEPASSDVNLVDLWGSDDD